MSNSKKLFIAYCEDNNNISEEISQKLKRVGFKFELLGSQKVKENTSLSDLILDKRIKGLLLISDNFLKSESCMKGMLEFINDGAAFNNVQVIITDGRYPTQSGNGFVDVETSFDRVSNVIKYMNFWQERYLDMRKERRTIAQAESVAFEEKLERVKNISAEIGDFLRLLRTKQSWRYLEYRNNDFEVFFKNHGDDKLYGKYKGAAINDPKVEPEIAEIPGLDRLMKAADKEIILPVLEEKIAKIDVNTAANIVQTEKEEKLTPVANDSPTKKVSAAEPEKQMDSFQEIQQENHSEITSSFEKQVEEIAEEIENEELILENEKQNPKYSDESEDSYETHESVYEEEEEEEEDITGDFDPMAEIMSDPIEADEQKEHPENGLNNELDADEMISDADEMIESGKINEAIFKLKEVLNLEPQNNGARYMYAMLLMNYKEDYDKASKQLKKVIKFDPQNAEAYEHLAKIAEFNNDFPLAKGYYEKVASLKPHTFGIYYKLGLITSGFFNDKKDLALNYFEKAIKQDKNNEDAHYRLGILLSESFLKPKKAIKYFKKVLKINPDHQFVNYDLALLYNELGDYKKASKFYKIAYMINPEVKTPENDIAFGSEKESTAKSEKIFTSTEDDRMEKIVPTSEKVEVASKNKMEPGKVVFITGATSGIGKATAELFAARGFRLILNGRRKDRLKAIQKEFKNVYETDSKILPFDVRNIDDVKKNIGKLTDEWSRVDILINNAGLAKGKDPIHEGQLDHWETMIDTNIKGLLYLTRAITPHMVKRQSGHIINICSSAGHEVYPDGNVYCATKFAVDALTKSMRLDLHKYKIRVGQVSPGHVEETEFAYVRHEDVEKAKIFEDFQPLNSKDVAEAIYYIATAPPHVNIQDIQMMGTQQASNVFIDRSGR